MNAPPDPAALAAALAIVQQFRSSRLGGDEWRAACETAAVWLAANAGELWRVRPLEWSTGWNCVHGDAHTSRCFFAGFIAWKSMGKWTLIIDDYTNDDEESSSHESLEDAKAKAFAYFCSRLAAALIPAIPEAAP